MIGAICKIIGVAVVTAATVSLCEVLRALAICAKDEKEGRRKNGWEK